MKAFFRINQFLLHLLCHYSEMLFMQQPILVLISLLFLKFVVGLDTVNVQLKSIKRSLKHFNILNADGNYLQDVDINEFIDIFNEMDRMLTIYEKNFEGDETNINQTTWEEKNPTAAPLKKAGIAYFIPYPFLYS